MHILILGGTIFLGPHLVEHARQRGHRVTLFHRGHHKMEFFPAIEQILGDRNGDLSALSDKKFDAIIDTSDLDPKVVKRGLEVLKEAAPHYTYISSVSVYHDFSSSKITETYPVYKQSNLPSDAVSENFGLRKSLCEEEVSLAFPNKSLIVRPGLIVGRYDPTDRFTYWVRRIKNGGNVLLPMMAQKKIQIIDVRDLAQWIIASIEKKTIGTFNAPGPDYHLSFQDLLAKISSVTKTQFEPIWVPEPFLLEKGIKEWTDLPLWLSESNAAFKFLMDIDNSKAIQHGLTFRAIEETIQDVSQWDDSRQDDPTMKAGITSEVERNLLSQLSA